MTETPNIVVLVLDTVRAQNVSVYGYDRDTTPYLDQLAANGTLYERAYTVAPWTLPAHASMFTGLYPQEHGANTKTKHLDESYDVLAEQLAEQGYHTAGFSNNLWLSPDRGMARGFDRFDLMWQRFDTEDIAAPLGDHKKPTAELLSVMKNVFHGNIVKRLANLVYGYRYRNSKRNAETTNKRILNHIDHVEEPFFLFANYMEAHLPYTPPQEYAERFLPEDVSYEEAMDVHQDPWDYVHGNHELDDRTREILMALYDAAINYLDEQIHELITEIEQKTDTETIFIVTSDHGENIGDHGLMNHQYSLENTVLRVPLVLYGDGVENQNMSAPVQLLDLYPTICSLADIAPEEPYHGKDISKVTELSQNRLCYAQYLEPSPPVDRLQERFGEDIDLDGRDRLETVISPDTKLVTFTDRTELRENTFEEQRISDEDTQEQVQEQLTEWHSTLQTARQQEETEIEENIKKRLEDLGY